MAKLKLDAESLQVQSFHTLEAARGRGTVRAHATEYTFEAGCTNVFQHCTGGSYDTNDFYLCNSNGVEVCIDQPPRRITDDCPFTEGWDCIITVSCDPCV